MSSNKNYPTAPPPQMYPSVPLQAPQLYPAEAPPPYQHIVSQHPPTNMHPYPQTFPNHAPPPYQSIAPQSQQSSFYPKATNSYPISAPSNIPENVAIIIPDGYDSQARFDNIARPNIPPPPPGVAPNAAQLAMMYGKGNQVILGQKKRSFW